MKIDELERAARAAAETYQGYIHISVPAVWELVIRMRRLEDVARAAQVVSNGGYAELNTNEFWEPLDTALAALGQSSDEQSEERDENNT